MRFAWSPGCEEAGAYQVRRNGKEFIGADFSHVVPVNDNVASDLVGFCAEIITPANQLQDDDATVLNDVGGSHTYCVRSLVEDVANEKTYTSDWTCTTMVVQWKGTFVGSLISDMAGTPVLGARVDAYLCDAGDAACPDYAARHEAAHSLADGGKMLTFSVYDAPATAGVDDLRITEAAAKLTECRQATLHAIPPSKHISLRTAH